MPSSIYNVKYSEQSDISENTARAGGGAALGGRPVFAEFW